MIVRVRYPPSPTGLQHIGSVRTALFNYLIARHTGGVFVLRIEDTDQERFDPDALRDIYDTFSWLGITWDEGPDKGGEYGPYVQSERSDLYKQYAQKLLDSGAAYYAYDTAEDLKAQREASDGKAGYDRKFRDMPEQEVEVYRNKGIAPVVRLKVPLDGRTAINDIVLGEMSWANQDISPDPVLLKSDGLPTYHLANVVDDHHMEITHILRGPEWVPSAPVHAILYKAFGWEPPQYCHLPLVVGDDGKKLSKRHGATRVLEFREKGYLPEAMINYLARVGWSYDDKTEIFSLEELVKLFTLEKVGKAPATFDYKKLDSLNGHYIREKSSDELFAAVAPYVISSGIVSDPMTEQEQAILLGAVPLIQERLKHLSDTPDLVRFLYQAPGEFDLNEMVPKKLDLPRTRDLIAAIAPLVSGIVGADDETNEQLFRDKAAELETKLGNLLMPIRVALTGSRVSPPLFGSIRLLGAEESTRRIETALDRMNTALADTE